MVGSILSTTTATAAVKHCAKRIDSRSILTGVVSSRRRQLFSSSPATTTRTQQQRRQQPTVTQRQRLDVAIVGLPNAGKSQLLNVLTGSNVAAVSRKRHTTRDEVLGARTVVQRRPVSALQLEDELDSNADEDMMVVGTQLVFVDTPGYLRKSAAQKDNLEHNLASAASSAMRNVDFTLLIVDAARKLTEDYEETLVSLMLHAVMSNGRREEIPEAIDDTIEGGENAREDDETVPLEAKFAIVLNKVDLVRPKSALLDLAMKLSVLAEHTVKYQVSSRNEEWEAEISEELLQELSPTFFYISALHNDGVDDVLEFLLERATPSREWPVASNEASNSTPEEKIEEIIREKIYRCLHREVPYAVKQQNRLLRVGRDKDGQQGIVIHQDLMVRTKSHLELIRGRTLERIREMAQRDLERILKCVVHLHLHVKLVKSKNRNWST